MQIAARFAGIAHVYPGYTHQVILDLPYELWVMLALAYDEHIQENERQRRKT